MSRISRRRPPPASARCSACRRRSIFQAVNQAVHLAFSTRQSRKGEISSWKAYVPGFSGKLAIEAVDRAMRGEASPSPIYEGEDFGDRLDARRPGLRIHGRPARARASGRAASWRPTRRRTRPNTRRRR